MPSSKGLSCRLFLCPCLLAACRRMTPWIAGWRTWCQACASCHDCGSCSPVGIQGSISVTTCSAGAGWLPPAGPAAGSHTPLPAPSGQGVLPAAAAAVSLPIAAAAGGHWGCISGPGIFRCHPHTPTLISCIHLSYIPAPLGVCSLPATACSCCCCCSMIVAAAAAAGHGIVGAGL
jgi:hypothetical protein